MLLQDDTLGLFPFEKAESEQYREWVNQEEFARLLGRVLPGTASEHEAKEESGQDQAGAGT